MAVMPVLPAIAQIESTSAPKLHYTIDDFVNEQSKDFIF